MVKLFPSLWAGKLLDAYKQNLLMPEGPRSCGKCEFSRVFETPVGKRLQCTNLNMLAYQVEAGAQTLDEFQDAVAEDTFACERFQRKKV